MPFLKISNLSIIILYNIFLIIDNNNDFKLSKYINGSLKLLRGGINHNERKVEKQREQKKKLAF